MTVARRGRAWLAAGLLGLLAAAAPAAAQSPTDQLRQYTDEVLKVFQETTLRENDTIAGVRAAVRKVMIEMFGLAEAAAAVLGPHWQALTDTQRQDFTRLFADLLEATYIVNMDRRGGVKIRYVGESVGDERATVRLQVRGKGRDDLPIMVTLLRRDGRWLIYDVEVDRISAIGNYRAQFDRIIRKSSYAEFVSAVQAKRDELLAKKRAATE